MENSGRSIYILLGIAILAVIGFRILPRMIGAFFGGMGGVLYVVAFTMGAIGIVVLGVRWWIKR